MASAADTTEAQTALAPLASALPPVERRAAMPAGFAAGATTAGIKPSGRPDLGLIRTLDGAAAAAAIFTTNALPAAPVLVSRTNLAASMLAEAKGMAQAAGEAIGRAADPATDPLGGRYGWAEAIVATSGSANAATGQVGLTDQLAIAQAVAVALGTDPLRVLCLSTGVIGTRLPVDRVRDAIPRLARGLATAPEQLEAAAVALRTTDQTTKVATTTVTLPAADGQPREVTVSGIAKGVGMIHPRMATMLAVVLTDAAAAPATLAALLRPAAARTWNQLSVDGDTSTNDTVFVLASGTSGAAPAVPGSAAAVTLGLAIEAVARDLARQQAADGEGATTLVTCQVSGAADDADARAIARAVIASSLVKTAVHGRDPNWGRIAAAAANARLPEVALLELAGVDHATACLRAGTAAHVDPEALRIAVAGTTVYDGPAGGPVPFDRPALSDAMRADEVVLRLDLGLGGGTGEAFGCDLSEEYVVENAEYTT